MPINKYILFASVLMLSGCSGKNDFTPSANTTGKEIFAQVCTECHAPVGSHIMEISAEMKDVDKIANKVLTGSFMMPAFPNIQGESASALAEYVLENSKTKE